MDMAQGECEWGLVYAKNTFYDVLVAPDSRINPTAATRSKSADTVRWSSMDPIEPGPQYGSMDPWPTFRHAGKSPQCGPASCSEDDLLSRVDTDVSGQPESHRERFFSTLTTDTDGMLCSQSIEAAPSMEEISSVDSSDDDASSCEPQQQGEGLPMAPEVDLQPDDQGDCGANTDIPFSMENLLPTVAQTISSAQSLSRSEFRNRIAASIQASHLASAMWVWNDMVKYGLVPDISDLDDVLFKCTTDESYNCAVQCWHMLTLLGLNPSPTTYVLMITACASAEPPEDAAGLLQDMFWRGASPFKSSFAQVVYACARVGSAVLAESCVSWMLGLGLHGDLELWNCLFAACAKVGTFANADTWLSLMREDGVNPDIRTYNYCIQATAKTGNVRAAFLFWLEIKVAYLQPNVHTFIALIDVCTAAGKFLEAHRWMNAAMFIERVLPNARIYNRMLHICAEAGDLARAATWFHDMKRHGLEPNRRTYESLVTAYAINAEQQGVGSLMVAMALLPLRAWLPAPGRQRYAHHVRRVRLDSIQHLGWSVLQRLPVWRRRGSWEAALDWTSFQLKVGLFARDSIPTQGEAQCRKRRAAGRCATVSPLVSDITNLKDQAPGCLQKKGRGASKSQNRVKAPRGTGANRLKFR